MVHGAVHTFFRTIAACLTFVVCGAALLAWRLADGPLTIDFLAPYVSNALTAERDGITFRVQGAVLDWKGLRSAPDIAVQKITVEDQSGEVIASFPEMLVRLSLEAMLDGTFAPKEVILDNPVVRLTRGSEGQLYLGLESNGETLESDLNSDMPNNFEPTNAIDDSGNQLLKLVVSALTDPGGSGNPGGYLDKVIVQESTVVFSDVASGTEWLVPSGDISLERESGNVRIVATLPFLNEGRNSEVGILGSYVVGAQTLSMTAEFKNLRPASFSSLAPNLSMLNGIEVDLDGTASVVLGLSGPSIAITSAQVEVIAGQGVLSLPYPVGRDYPIRDFKMLANAGAGLDSVDVETLHLALQNNGPVLTLGMAGESLSSAPSMELVVAIDRVTLDELKSYWPTDIKPNTLAWITRNLSGGVIESSKFDISMSGSELDTLKATQLSGGGDLSGVSVTYLRQMPPVQGTGGRLNMSLSEVVIDIDSGFVKREGVDEDPLMVQEARVRLHGTERIIDRADIDIRLAGELSDAIHLLNQPPLEYASKLGFAPSATSGRAEVLLSLDFPLLQGVTLNEVKVSATASLEKTSIREAALGLDLESGQFRLEVDNSGMDVRGTASLGGIRTGLAWRENFTVGDFKRQYALDAVVENDQRSLVGLGHTVFAPPYVDGPVRMEAIYTLREDNQSTLNLEADLVSAALNVPPLNWTKPINIPGILSADIRIVDGVLYEVTRFEVSSPDSELQFSGAASFAGATEIQSLVLDPGVIGKSQFSLSATRDSEGVLDISMQGSALDGRAFWSSFRESNSARSFGADEQQKRRLRYKFSGELNEIVLANSGVMRNVTAIVVQDEQGISEIQIEGSVAENDLFRINMVPDGEIRQFEAYSENGGAVLSSLGLGNSFHDGLLSVSGTVDEAGGIGGEIEIETFRIVGAPLLARLLSVAALTGIVDELQGNGISFSKLNLPFSYSGGEFEIREGTMYGSSLGLTANGLYDTNRNTIDGSGTIIPAYAVNSALGGIPLLGPLLTGGEEKGGVFAATFVMRGNPDGGEITVNPLATLTPGFLRQIFKVFEPPPAQEVDRQATKDVAPEE